MQIRQVRYSIQKRYLILARELFNLAEPKRNTPSISEQRQGRLWGSITFIAFALEASINEFIFEHCKKESHALERMSTPDKWLIIPRLFNNRDWDFGNEPLQSIKKIFSIRDVLVHYKPAWKEMRDEDYSIPRIKISFDLVREHYRQAIKAMQGIYGKCGLDIPDWLIDYSEDISDQ